MTLDLIRLGGQPEAWEHTAQARPTEAAVASEHLPINFGDFQSSAELTYPARVSGGSPRPYS